MEAGVEASAVLLFYMSAELAAEQVMEWRFVALAIES